MRAHSPTPWIKVEAGNDRFYIADAEKKLIACTGFSSCSGDDELGNLNTEHIIACVNACAGIETHKLINENITIYINSTKANRVNNNVFLITYLISVIGKNTETMLHRVGELPFLPTLGMAIDTGEGNPRKVVDICYRADIGELAVSFEDEEGYSLKFMKNSGWVVL